MFFSACVCALVCVPCPPLCQTRGAGGDAKTQRMRVCVCVCECVCVLCERASAYAFSRARACEKRTNPMVDQKRKKQDLSPPFHFISFFPYTRAPPAHTHTPTPQTCRLTSSCVDAGISYHGKSLAGQGSLPLQAPPLPLQRACPFSFPRAHSLSPSPLDRRLRPRKVQHLAGLRGRVL